MVLISISAKLGCRRRAWVNFSWSSAITRHGAFATAVALLGAPSITASSPKISAAFTVPMGLPPASRPTSPLSSR